MGRLLNCLMDYILKQLLEMEFYISDSLITYLNNYVSKNFQVLSNIFQSEQA